MHSVYFLWLHSVEKCAYSISLDPRTLINFSAITSECWYAQGKSSKLALAKCDSWTLQPEFTLVTSFFICDLHLSLLISLYWLWSSVLLLLLLLLRQQQLCLTLCYPIDGSPPGSPVPGILQARTLELVAISFSNPWKWNVKVKSLGHIQLFVTPWTAAYQAPPSTGFSRQEPWSGVPLPSPGSSVPPFTKSAFSLNFSWDTWNIFGIFM